MLLIKLSPLLRRTTLLLRTSQSISRYIRYQEGYMCEHQTSGRLLTEAQALTLHMCLGQCGCCMQR